MELLAENLPLLMFLTLVGLIFTGLPVAVVLGGTAILFASIGILMGEMHAAQMILIVNRIYGGIIESQVLVAVPMFVLMGTFLERSGVAEDLLSGLQQVLRRVPGGIAIAVTMMGTILAASTGIIGASVVMLTLLAMPVMLARGYAGTLASGTVAAAGTLGILIPPSIMLVIMGDLLSIYVGRLFMGALIPGLGLAALYLVYLVVTAALRPSVAPPLPADERPVDVRALVRMLSAGLLTPLALIVLILGSILAGWATPTEASGVGAAGALLAALVRQRLTLRATDEVLQRTVLTSSMIFFIFVDATAFSYVFRLLGGEEFIIGLVGTEQVNAWAVLFALLLLVFVLGFFLDWIEITLIVMPIFAPIVGLLDFGDHVARSELVYWFAVLVAINLQTSFLTPPFGFAMFYMKGATPPGLAMKTIYKGIVPFVLLQLAALGLVILFPYIALWLPRTMFG